MVVSRRKEPPNSTTWCDLNWGRWQIGSGWRGRRIKVNTTDLKNTRSRGRRYGTSQCPDSGSRGGRRLMGVRSACAKTFPHPKRGGIALAGSELAGVVWDAAMTDLPASGGSFQRRE